MALRSYFLPRQPLRSILTLLVAMLAFSSVLLAQGAPILKSKGKDFWVAFMSNLGSNDLNEVSDLRLYFSCDRPSSVTITSTLTGDTRVVPIPTANVTVEFNVTAEFGGFVELSDVTGAGDEIQPKSLHIVANDEITVYGANIRAKSADAFLGLPIDVLTGRYIVLAYPNGFSGPFLGSGTYDTPSEFAVVATEDGTVLNVNPTQSLTINGRPIGPYSVSLNRGEVYFGQADVLPFSEQDVTGTQLDANKPVAVFGGNKRTSIPTRVGNYRDHLCEQLPPLDAWGRGGLLTPHFKVTPQSTDTAVARIIAAFTGTDLTITGASGIQRFTIGPGVSIEIPLTEPMSVTGSQPIMMAQYEHSVNIATAGSFDIGDPFMMLVVPTEQFDTSYAFISIIHSEFTNQHYINVVIQPQGVGSLMLDNKPVPSTFLPIPGSSYVYTQLRVSEGSHYIRSDSAFGLYVYGFGHATSYGYPGGMLFRKLVRDFEPPDLAIKALCGDVTGFTSDSRITDSGIDSCYATKDTQNVKIDIDPFQKGADTVRFRAHLIDRFRDGVVVIRGIDGEGRSRTQSVAVAGFTVRFSGSNTVPAALDTFVAVNARDFCRRVEIKNYGKFDQRITGVILSDTTMRSVDTSQFPITIPSGGTASIEICFHNVGDTIFTTLMSLVGDCDTRDVAYLPVDSRVDTTAATVGIEGAPCSDDFIITYFKRFRQSGIASVEIDSTINCIAENLTDPTKLPAQQVQVHLHRVDPRQDMTYQITLRDEAGNSLTDVETIGGFTLNVLSRTGDTIGLRYDKSWDASDSIDLNGRFCDSVAITNYGAHAVHIGRAIVNGNVLFSVPPSQLPMSILPGTTRNLMVCIEGITDTDLSDTLQLVDDCGHVEAVAMKTALRPLGGATTDGCGAIIGFSVSAATKRAFITTPQPNPVASVARVDVGLPAASTVSIDVYSSAGLPMLHVLNGVALKSGISSIAFNVAALPPGAYFCRMHTSEGTVQVVKLIVQR